MLVISEIYPAHIPSRNAVVINTEHTEITGPGEERLGGDEPACDRGRRTRRTCSCYLLLRGTGDFGDSGARDVGLGCRYPSASAPVHRRDQGRIVVRSRCRVGLQTRYELGPGSV